MACKGGRMQPVRQRFASSDAQAISRLKDAWLGGKLKWVTKPYWRKNNLGLGYFRRGLIQITHEPHYAKFGISAHFDRAIDLKTSVSILFDGMIYGSALASSPKTPLASSSN